MPELYKVVAVDNYARETVADWLVADRLAYGAAMALRDWWRRDCDTYSSHWYEIYPQEKKLWGGMAEFM